MSVVKRYNTLTSAWEPVLVGALGPTGPAGANGTGLIICTSTTVPSSPSVGQIIYETDSGDFLAYYGATTGWRRPWGIPWGRMASVTTSATRQTITAAGTDVTGLAVTIDQIAGRRLKFTIMLGVLGVTAASVAYNFTINTGTSGAGTNISGNLGESKVNLGDYTIMTYVSEYPTTTAGATTSYHLRLSSLTANGIAIVNDLGLGRMWVEDIGPSLAPPAS